jgi:chaperonin GroEL (HSP60 family)
MATVLQNVATPAELARDAFRELLTERPDFIDTARYSINEVVPFLEQEDGFPKWLGYFENNMRALSAVWIQTAKQMKASSAMEKVDPKPVQATQNTAKVETPKQTVEEEAKPKTPKKPKESTAPVVDIKPAIVLKDETPPAVLEEQAITQSRALAEQFAIVKHHEIALRQASMSIEEATEALNRARQSHANAITAYSNALEDLARMLASSLGAKTSEFTKLLAKVATSDPAKK